MPQLNPDRENLQTLCFVSSNTQSELDSNVDIAS
jgi:hypothetical protein